MKYTTHSNAFNYKVIAYSVGDVKTPIPIPVGLFGYFFGAFAFMFVLGALGICLFGNRILHYILTPLFITWLLSKIEPEDKVPVQWAKDYFSHFFLEPKMIAGFRPMQEIKCGRFGIVDRAAISREKDPVNGRETRAEKKEKRRRAKQDKKDKKKAKKGK